MKSNNIKIGVLGGIGPEATSYFYKKLIEQIQSVLHPKRNTDFPQIIINSIPASELIYSKKISDEELSVYKKGIEDLNKHKPDFIVMVCNTIHLFYDDLQKVSNAKVINMREVILKRIADSGCGSVCILGTPSTISNNLYYAPGKKYLNLTKKQSSLITKIIENYNLGKKVNEQRQIFNKLLNNVRGKCDLMVLSCTELALLNENRDKKIMNSLDIMVEETIGTIKNKE